MTPSHISSYQQSTEGFYTSKVNSPSNLPVKTFLPVYYEPNYAYPLLVFLHGHGSSEDSVLRYAPHISRRNFIAISLRGRQEVTIQKNGKFEEGYSWGSQAQSDAWVEDYLFNAIEKTRDFYHIHSRRIYLVGFCEGATLAYRMALQFPEQFAGMVSLNGCLPRQQRPLWRVNQMRHIKLFMGHGVANSVIPMGMALEDRLQFQMAGVEPCWRTYGTNHRLHVEMFKDTNRWIMGHVEKDWHGTPSFFKG
ncbi:MAG: hypothetical protein EXR99_03815 [Gemmataceae bacterium]|nr:hypothetical protein [Gemmataceae bacterium]